ncbi:hypothetical protein TNCV_104131 [Trichonephila clavipes]|nr:hypothetical protein TNCV_104131 [Trichonephila clavipes]
MKKFSSQLEEESNDEMYNSNPVRDRVNLRGEPWIERTRGEPWIERTRGEPWIERTRGESWIERTRGEPGSRELEESAKERGPEIGVERKERR